MTCRLCGGSDLGPVIDLGPMPLVNNLLETPDAPCPRWPLAVEHCRACGLAQLAEAPDPDLMFSTYCYFSSQSQTMVSHAARLVAHFVEPGDRVVEIASNDGYLLRPALERGAIVLGVEPARNVAEHAESRGIPTLCRYFDRRVAREIAGSFGHADVIFANNVLAHVPDPNEIAAGIARLLAPRGLAHIEVPWLVRLVEQRAFDTIYHEHYCYFSLLALRALFARHGLVVVAVDEVPIHGGSLHVQVAHEGSEDEADAWCADERARGLPGDAFFSGFEDRVEVLRAELVTRLDAYGPVPAFGAAAKGVVLLNAFGLGTDRVPWVADVSPHKQGRFVPGTRQPIVPPARLLAERPAACMVLAWNIAPEIRRRNHAYEDGGGIFIVPVPEVRVLGAPAAT